MDDTISTEMMRSKPDGVIIDIEKSPDYSPHARTSKSHEKEARNGATLDSLCYLTVLKCQLPPSTYAPPAITFTRPNALLSSRPTIQVFMRNFCRMHRASVRKV
ncbi:hypothetical protein EYC84_010844 [Monilinia fructicola]|uniref:Uncharacterized protein n=1 Tax=Monilinia fructicola TaxID=38448 RepID=A0A5M9JB46_MONFR|nr:hypothetical protein EYC84_010844 [Monilinia fructicola]